MTTCPRLPAVARPHARLRLRHRLPNALRSPLLLRSFALAILALLGVLPAAPLLRAAGHCNVLLLMTDEHNPGILGCYGDPLVRTPTLDSLAAAGVRFDAAYCQNPICVPSRVSLVSGRMASNLGIRGNGSFPDYPPGSTLADVFRAAGYSIAWFGKTHWGDPRFPAEEAKVKKPTRKKGGAKEAKGKAPESGDDEKGSRLPQDSSVSSWPAEQNPEHVTADRALAFLDENRSRRFFLGVSFSKPHFPFTIQQKYYDLYKDRVGLPHAPAKLVEELPAVSRNERQKYRHAEATEAEILRTRAIYYGMVTYVDEEFGRILRKLDELGLREDTLILYTADHGEMLGERGIWYKNSFYDPSVRIPLLWSWPKALPRGRSVAAPVMNLDIFPTLCELAGLKPPPGLEGNSLAGLLRGTEDGAGRIARSENYRAGHSGRMIRTSDWKYFYYQNGEEFLYDMRNDPREEKNLAALPEHRQRVLELRRRAASGWVDAGGVKETKKPR